MSETDKKNDLNHVATTIDTLKQLYPHVMNDLPDVRIGLDAAAARCRARYQQLTEDRTPTK